MFVAPISNQNFTALVPASQYKGPVLKLTPKDKKKIAELVSKKADLELELNSIERLLDKKKTIIESSSLMYRRDKILGQISVLDEMIKTIKINRLEKQKTGAEKIDLVV